MEGEKKNPVEIEHGEQDILEACRAEAARIKAEKADPHFEEAFEPGELTSRDAEMWQKIKEGNVSFGEIREYQGQVAEDEGGKPGKHPTTRENFAAYLTNKATIILLQQK